MTETLLHAAYSKLLIKVNRMRAAQIDYFNARKSGYSAGTELSTAKRLEHEVDKLVKTEPDYSRGDCTAQKGYCSQAIF